MSIFNYKIVTGPGLGEASTWRDTLNELGQDGWEFKGRDCYGQMVFMKEALPQPVITAPLMPGQSTTEGPLNVARKRTKRKYTARSRKIRL